MGKEARNNPISQLHTTQESRSAIYDRFGRQVTVGSSVLFEFAQMPVLVVQDIGPDLSPQAPAGTMRLVMTCIMEVPCRPNWRLPPLTKVMDPMPTDQADQEADQADQAAAEPPPGMPEDPTGRTDQAGPRLVITDAPDTLDAPSATDGD